MRTRSSRRPEDSLDLLLDTICNTFGGVLFIAILVILLLNSAPGRREVADKKSSDDPRARERLIRQMSLLESEVATLDAAATAQRQALLALAPEETS